MSSFLYLFLICIIAKGGFMSTCGLLCVWHPYLSLGARLSPKPNLCVTLLTNIPLQRLLTSNYYMLLKTCSHSSSIPHFSVIYIVHLVLKLNFENQYVSPFLSYPPYPAYHQYLIRIISSEHYRILSFCLISVVIL